MSAPFKKVKKHRFNGKAYKIRWKKPRNCEGLCACPDNKAKDRIITIQPNLDPKNQTLVMLHEGLHACAFYLDEETVTRISEDLNDFLWKCGVTLKQE